jgi:hypothetical protein
MSRRCLPIVVVLAAGCGSSSSVPPDAPDGLPAQPADAGQDRSVLDAPSDAAADSRPAPTGLPLPAGVMPARKLFEDSARLTGAGPSGCSQQEPPSGDGHRWCVFSKPAGGATELWTVDVSAATRTAPACDGTSPACLRLTGALWTEFPLGGPVHPYSHEFHGDTLIYYADAVSRPNQLHRGPTYAWRPGWAQPRRISSETSVMCWGHPRLPLAHCLEDLVGPAMMPDLVEVRAGALADTAGASIPSVQWLRTYANGAPSWQAAFSPAGDLFALSSPDPDPAVETLRVVPTAELGRTPPRELLRDVNGWDISRDGQHLLFFRFATKAEKALHVADFPAGTNVTRLATQVRDFLSVGSAEKDAIIYVTESDPDHGALHLVRDLRAPMVAPTIFTYSDPIEDVRLSTDLRYTAWVDGHFRIRVVDNVTLASCDLNASPRRAGFAPVLLDSGALVFWTEEAPDDPDRRDAWLATATCASKRRFAERAELILPVGDRGVVFTDESDDERVTLKYAATPAGQWPDAGPVRIHDNVDPTSVFLVGAPSGTAPVLVMFRVVGGPEAGTYVFGPLPF